METLRIKIKNKETLDHLMWFLGKFTDEELQITKPDEPFENAQQKLQEELNKLDKGTSDLMELEDFDRELELVITGYES